MLNVVRSAALTTRSVCRKTGIAAFNSSARARAHASGPVPLDPSLEELLRDADMSFKGHGKTFVKRRELEVVGEGGLTESDTFFDHEWSTMGSASLDSVEDTDLRRKSPAALFGSHHIGAVVLPIELQDSINRLITDADKSQLHSDAKRLFQAEGSGDGLQPIWDIQRDTKYHSRHQAARHAIRDGTALASVALPAHFSAIIAVLSQIKRRLGPDLDIKRVFDWGTGTGSGLWASLYSFHSKNSSVNPSDLSHIDSALTHYLGIDKREGLTTIAKRIVSTAPEGKVQVTWQKSFREENVVSRGSGHDALALSAFMLSALPNPLAQKEMVKEMWDSGADTIVLIDHNNEAGFEAIAHAREYLLKMGRTELDNPDIESHSTKGCHIVAPCPHDRPCPLLDSKGSLICGFSQRLQRPSFVRKTKHSGVGHEDVGYSYIIMRRGPRPALVDTSVGRVGSVGRQDLQKQAATTALRQLSIHEPNTHDATPTALTDVAEEVGLPSTNVDEGQLEGQLRQEAYQWPRLIFPPLKKSGHIILDACTNEGKIMRMTIPKSQGKQPFYDARKSSWGDIFPHPPKKSPIERYQPKSNKAGQPPKTGGDIGKRRDLFKNKERADYTTIAKSLREGKKLSKRDYARTRVDKAWQD